MPCLWSLGAQVAAFAMLLHVPDGQITSLLIKTNDAITTILKSPLGNFSLILAPINVIQSLVAPWGLWLHVGLLKSDW